MKIFKKYTYIVLLCFFLAEISFASSGIGVRPLRTSVELNPGESKEIYLNIINKENFTQYVDSEFQSYVSHDKSGYPVAKNIGEDDPRNISSWIKFEYDENLVKANTEKKIKITIKAPKNSEPGGRYGALIFGPVIKGDGGVAVRTRVASLLLVTVKGDEKFDGEVTNFSLKDNKIFSDKDIIFDINFKNKGNTHVNPKGMIEIFKDGKKISSIFSFDGKEDLLSEIPVNYYSNYVLPELERVYTSNWSKSIINGEYSAKLHLNFKKKNKNITESKEINFKILDSLEVSNFEFVNENKKSYFILNLKNTGTVYEKLKGKINILNEFDFKIAEVIIPENIEYIEPGKDKEFKILFLEKELPEGQYKTSSEVFYGIESKKLELNEEFGKNKNLAIYIIIFVLLLILAIWILKLKRKK